MIEPLLQAERLLLHGMLDQAEELFRRTAEQDPLNSIAVVGLARVALERGNDQLAYEHARAALMIDPQNVAAVRLEARLAEVLQLRHASAAAGAAPGASSGTRDRPPDAATLGRPAAPPAAAGARPSETAVFTRNPSMADHQRRLDEEQRRQHGARADLSPGQVDTAQTDRLAPRPSLLRRLFRGGG